MLCLYESHDYILFQNRKHPFLLLLQSISIFYTSYLRFIVTLSFLFHFAYLGPHHLINCLYQKSNWHINVCCINAWTPRFGIGIIIFIVNDENSLIGNSKRYQGCRKPSLSKMFLKYGFIDTSFSDKTFHCNMHIPHFNSSTTALVPKIQLALPWLDTWLQLPFLFHFFRHGWETPESLLITWNLYYWDI